MKEQYESVEIKVIVIDREDVIIASNGDCDNDGWTEE